MQTAIASRKNTPTGKVDAAWNLIGSMIYAGCQWLVLVATVRLSSPANVGRLSLAFALTAPIFLLLQLRLRAASATDATLAYTDRQYALLRLVCTTIAIGVTIAFCAGLRLQREDLIVVLWVALAKAIESGSDLIYGLLQQRHQLRAVALSMSARGVLSAVAFCLLLHKSGRLPVALAGFVAAWTLVFLFIDVPLALASRAEKKEVEPGHRGSVLRLAWLTLPLGLSTMFMSLSANMPRYFVQHTLGIAALGVFSASAYLTMTGSVIVSAVAEASIARMAKYFADGQLQHAMSILRRVRNLTLLLSMGLVALSVVGGRTLLVHLYRPAYAGTGPLLTLMMCAAAAANMASVYAYALLAARRFNQYLVCLICSSVATAIACAVAVPRWGAMGAAAGCLLGYAVQFAISWVLLDHYMNSGIAERTSTIQLTATAPALKS